MYNWCSFHSGQPALPTVEGSKEARRPGASVPTGLSRMVQQTAKSTRQRTPSAQRRQPAPEVGYSKFGPVEMVGQGLLARDRGRVLSRDQASCRTAIPGMCTSSARPQGPRRWARLMWSLRSGGVPCPRHALAAQTYIRRWAAAPDEPRGCASSFLCTRKGGRACLSAPGGPEFVKLKGATAMCCCSLHQNRA